VPRVGGVSHGASARGSRPPAHEAAPVLQPPVALVRSGARASSKRQRSRERRAGDEPQDFFCPRTAQRHGRTREGAPPHSRSRSTHPFHSLLVLRLPSARGRLLPSRAPRAERRSTHFVSSLPACAQLAPHPRRSNRSAASGQRESRPSAQRVCEQRPRERRAVRDQLARATGADLCGARRRSRCADL
jgi:hypothetical protein